MKEYIKIQGYVLESILFSTVAINLSQLNRQTSVLFESSINTSVIRSIDNRYAFDLSYSLYCVPPPILVSIFATISRIHTFVGIFMYTRTKNIDYSIFNIKFTSSSFILLSVREHSSHREALSTSRRYLLSRP